MRNAWRKLAAKPKKGDGSISAWVLIEYMGGSARKDIPRSVTVFKAQDSFGRQNGRKRALELKAKMEANENIVALYRTGIDPFWKGK